MKNEKAPNLQNYEKVARTTLNVIGMQFYEVEKKIWERERKIQRIFVCIRIVCMCSSRLNVLYDENRCRNFWIRSIFALAVVVLVVVLVDSRRKVLVLHVTI